MFSPLNSKTKRKIKPILYPQAFLEKKIEKKWDTSDDMSILLSLMKYFPKYYTSLTIHNRLEIGGRSLRSRSFQSRVKQLKIVKRFSYKTFSDSYDYDYENHQKTFKRLYRDFRKTLKSVPYFDGRQDLSFCMDFPRVKTINIQPRCFKRICYSGDETDFFDRYKERDLAKVIKKSCGYFWIGNRFVEILRIKCYHPLFLIIIQKLNASKRFLSSLKTFELEVGSRGFEREVGHWSYGASSDLLIKLTENKNVLQYVTFIEIIALFNDLNIVQSLINCCPRLLFFSLESDYKFDGSLNLGCLQNLQVLYISQFDFQTFINIADFGPSIQKITLRLSGKRMKEFFDFQDGDDEDQDAREWKAFEKDRILCSFFEKWRRFENLKALNLKLAFFSNMDFLMKMLLLPLIREKSWLETLEFELNFFNVRSEEDGVFDLDVFFQGIKSLKSLKNLSIFSLNCYFIYSPQKSLFLPNLSSLDLFAKSSPKFDILKFLNGVYHNLGSQPRNEKTSLGLSKIRLHSAQELITLLKLLNKASKFKTLQIYLEVELYVQDVDELISNFRYPIYVPSNTNLKVHLFEADSDWNDLTQKKKLNLREGPYEFPQIQSFFKSGYE